MSKHLIHQFVREFLVEEVRKKFEMSLPDDLVRLAHAFKSEGHQLFVVGGSVRDALQGKEPKDYDVATDATPDISIKIVRGIKGCKVVEVGKAFGVVICITPEGGEYEISTFREDVGKGRRPDSVNFTDIKNDVKRRDLTINALFYDIDAGEIVDYVGGIADIENGIVRAVGNPKERFDEDKLRILRALRFAARMGSGLDPETSQAIKDDNSLEGVSAERIRDEFIKGIKSAKNVGNFFDLIVQYDLWPQIFPGLRVQDAFVGERDIPTVLALILDENDPGIVEKKLNSLKYTGIEAEQASFMIRFKQLTIENSYRMKKLANQVKVTPSQLEAYSAERGVPDLRLVSAFVEYKPSVNGGDLKASGFTGAELGKELERREIEIFGSIVGT